MKRLKNFNLKFDRIKIWSIHIKTKHITGVIGDSRWPKYHPNITQSSPDYTNAINLVHKLHPDYVLAIDHVTAYYDMKWATFGVDTENIMIIASPIFVKKPYQQT